MTVFGASLSIVSGLLLSAYLTAAWMLAAAGIGMAVLLFAPLPYRRSLAVYISFSILAGLYFDAYEILHRSTLKPWAEQERTVWVRGYVDSPINRDGDAARFFMKLSEFSDARANWQPLANSERIALKIKLAQVDEVPLVEKWRRGSEIAVPVRFSLPAAARNPYAFDYARYLHWQGVQVTGEADFAAVQILREKRGLWSQFQNWQDDAGTRIEKLFPDPVTAGYMKSLLVGLGADVSPELQAMYADLGLSHILAISGLHVTLVNSMFLWCLERAGVGRKWAMLTTVIMLLGYVMLVGASSSAVRSGLMGAVGLAVQVLGKSIDGREIWSGALIVMLLVNPYQLWQVGFQLSFVVTLGLIVFVPFSQHVFVRVPLWIRTLLAVTFTAQAVSFPFLIYHFHQSSSVSWFVNMLATPVLSSVVLPLGYCAVMLGLVHPVLAAWPAAISTKLLAWIHEPLFVLQSWALPFSHWPHPDWWWLMLYGLFLCALPILWKLGYHRQRDMILYAALFLGLIITARQPFSGTNEVRITFLDVGQGDSIVVEIGHKKVYLMDAGGSLQLPVSEPWREKRDPFEVGKDVVLPFLRARGIEHIDRVVMTHGDMDHIGGIEALIPRFSFGELLVNGSTPEGKEGELIRRFRQRGVPLLTGEPGQTWSDLPGVSWTWLHPGQTSLGSGNDASVVLQLTAYGTTVLFTGDIERDGETRIMERGLPEVDVLKVAHHGSKTSSSADWLALAKPKYAVISAGARNRYGHPSPDVLERFLQAGTTVYRTDRQGAITLHIKPTGITWLTQVPHT